MNTVFRFCMILLFGLAVTASAYAQVQDERPFEMPQSDLPNFYFDILNYPVDSATASRLDVYLQIPYEMLSFVKNDNRFTAQYEVTLTVNDEKGALITEKLWSEEIITKDYAQSVSATTGKISQRSFILPYGKYIVTAQVRDTETKKIRQVKRPAVARNFNDSTVAMSDIMVVRQMEKEGDKTVVVPNVAATMTGTDEEIRLYFELKADVALKSLVFITTMKDKMGFVVRKDSTRQEITKKNQASFVSIRAKSLIAGDYEVQVTAYSGDTTNARTALAMINRKVTVKMQGIPFSVTDLDLAVEQLIYIAPKDTYDSLRAAAPNVKREMFLAFWKQRDPSKDTELNELMQEYYQRVEFTNKNYTHYIDGWKTDRGNIYIVFGEPNNIERHPFEIDSKPYEVWTYYKLNREFVFIDESGFGDYRLRNPSWDVWRTRTR